MAFSVGTLTGYVKANERELLTKSLFSAKSISLASKMPNVKSSSQLNLMDTDAVFQSEHLVASWLQVLQLSLVEI